MSFRLKCCGMAALICLAPFSQALAQASYVPDITEARQKEWRSLVMQAQSAYSAGRAAEAIGPARKALVLADELFGADDPRSLISANDLALQLDATGSHREAETLYRRVFDGYLRTRGADDPNSQLALENLVDFYVARHRNDAALPLGEYALASFRRTTGTASERSRRMEAIVAGLREREGKAAGGPEMGVQPAPAETPADAVPQ